jgi:hypothetical protein
MPSIQYLHVLLPDLRFGLLLVLLDPKAIHECLFHVSILPNACVGVGVEEQGFSLKQSELL